MTDKFTVSQDFGYDYDMIWNAVKKSILPEGISVIKMKGLEKAKGEFLVVAAAPYASDSIAAIKKGAIDYITLVLDEEEMTRRFNGAVSQ